MTAAPATNELLALADRERFIEAHHHYLSLDEIPDAWGDPMFKHSHVDAMWNGWKKGRAALRAAATPSAQGVEVSVEELATEIFNISPSHLWMLSARMIARTLLGKYRMEKRP